MSPRPELVNQPVPPLITALDDMLRLIAAAPGLTQACLASCPRCRNRLLYLLDTVPYQSDGTSTIRARLAALPDVHASFHQAGDTDANIPQIRGILA